jgi:hypothetical protein
MSEAPPANVFSMPQPYDLTNDRELMRLMREVLGYLDTCDHKHHGTDYEGRRYAIAALKQISAGEIRIRTY